MTEPRRHKRTPSRTVVAFSVSYQKESLLARGMGLEHLKELVSRLARPMVSEGLSVAYAGHWRVTEDNFTHLLLQLISAEQDDTSDDPEQNPDAARTVAPLINHLAWPHYLTVTPRIEAEAINSCRIVRVTQEQAGIADVCPDGEAFSGSDRAVFNAAATLSAMRRFQTEGMSLDVVPGERTEDVPPLAARILIGGKVSGSSGFAPGILEEAVLMLERGTPLYVLGGFGGVAGELAQLFLGSVPPPDITVDRLESGIPALTRLRQLAEARGLPPGCRATADLIESLRQKASAVAGGAVSLASAMNTGLGDADLRALMTTGDVDKAVRLVLSGLRALGLLVDPT
ncbi:MAG: hypothetical protein JW940_17660 [Polyangiaceae bacterium]|nr:hypothetical protein [Polyangiaceae bacterium]